MVKSKFEPEIYDKVKKLMKNNIKLSKLRINEDFFMNDYTQAYENYLKERREFLFEYSVKYEWKPEYTSYDKGAISYEQFVEYTQNDSVFANKWLN